jgi:hypothetical protein
LARAASIAVAPGGPPLPLEAALTLALDQAASRSRAWEANVEMRLRLSDAAALALLAEHYNTQAEMSLQMARVTVSPVKDGWLELAAELTKLARETDARAALEH